MAEEVHDPKHFSDFNIHHVNYKVVNDHPIPLSILVPKKLVNSGSNQTRPWIAHFHGGWLVSGARLFSPWFSKWLVDFAAAEEAILVTPDYRLLPEANGHDILADLTSFWEWVPAHLNRELATLYPNGNIQVDLEQLVVGGESAGGYMAAQSALLHPELSIKALLLTYGMLDLRTPHWTEAYTKPIFGIPNMPVSVLEDHLKNIPAGAVVTTDGDPEKGEAMTRLPIAVAAVQNGRFLDMLGTDSVLFPLENVSRATQFPPFVWLHHGKQDSAVPVEGTVAFAKAVESAFPSTEVRVDLQDGEHGFDTAFSADVDWIRAGLDKVKSYWA